MRKIGIVILGLFLLVTALARAATPELIRVRNYAGPIAVTFGASGVVGTVSQYKIYIATSPLIETTTDQADANSKITAINWYMTSNTTYYYTQAVDKTVYYVKIAVKDGSGWSTTLSAQDSDTSLWGKTVANITSVTGIDGFTINFDSQTATISFNVTDINGAPAIPEKLDITITGGGKTVYTETIYSFSITDTGATASITWDGSWTTVGHEGHKHNGVYSVVATPTGYDGKAGQTDGFNIGVNVVHFNEGELVYTKSGSNMPTYGPPFTLEYYLSHSAFIMWRIYDRNQTADTSDDIPIRVMVSSAPRTPGDTNPPSAVDDFLNAEVWDGRNNNGAIVPNDIYRYTFQAWEFWGEPGSGFNESITDRSNTVEGTITYDVLRIVDLKATGITSSGGTASISYFLGGANQVQGGATTKIIICKPNTHFTMASSAGTLTYLNGHTYSYVAGDLIPHTTDNLVTPAPTRIVKTFSFARQAGQSWTETWDGKDEDGSTLANDNYIYGISATDDSGNHAIDNSGNDQPMWGNITIDRTASQSAGDTVAPTVNTASLTPAAGSIQTSGISQISCVITDTAQTGMTAAGFNVAASTIILTGPSGNITGTKSYDLTTGMLILSFATPVTANGTYTARVVPTDNSGNTATETTWTFSINVTASGAASTFESSVKAYPNPAKGVPANIAYNINAPSTLTLEIFNLLGDLVYEKEWTKSAAGAYTEVWNLVNDSGSKIGSGVFIYKIKANDGTSTYSVTKKLIAIQ